MAASKNCSACGKLTTCIILAQYLHEKTNSEAYICYDCYQEGHRCWFLQNKTFEVSKKQPENSKQAVLYWDEALCVTMNFPNLDTIDTQAIPEVTYPDKNQPT